MAGRGRIGGQKNWKIYVLFFLNLYFWEGWSRENWRQKIWKKYMVYFFKTYIFWRAGRGKIGLVAGKSAAKKTEKNISFIF